AVSKTILKDLLCQNAERLKELQAINTTSQIVQHAKNLEEALSEICAILPDSFQYPDCTVVRIKYNKNVFVSENFEETQWGITQSFQSVSNKRGCIEVFYTKKFPDIDEGPFLKEERSLLINLATIISGRAVKDVFSSLQRMNVERLKELDAINRTSRIIEEANSVQEVLQRICTILPESWQYPKYTACKITFEGETFVTPNFKNTPWMQYESIYTIDDKKGNIEIAYLKKFPDEYVGPFLLEEQNLLHTISKLISWYLNSFKGIEILSKKNVPVSTQDKTEEFRKSLIQTKRPLQLYFNQQSLETYVY